MVKYANQTRSRKFISDAIKHRGKDECLVWPFGKTGLGYGVVRYGNKVRTVHRIVCEAVHGAPTHPKQQVVHSCGNPSCVNPHHLRWSGPQLPTTAPDGCQGCAEAARRITDLEAHIAELRETISALMAPTL